MSRSYGYNSQLLMKQESSYGADPSGNYNKMPFISSDIGENRGYQESPRAGAGRTKKEIFKDAPVLSGDVQVPMCMRNMAFWLSGLLGVPVTTGASDPWTHTWTSESLVLPSFVLEPGHINVPAYYQNLGVMVNTMSLEFGRSGPAMASFGLMGKAETKNVTSQGGTPVDRAAPDILAWASYLEGSVQKASSNLGNLNSGRLFYSNNLVPQELLNQTNGEIAAIDPGEVSVTGSLNMRFATTSELDSATAGTPVDLDFIYDLGGNMSLQFTVHEAYLEKTTPPITGPGGVDVDLNFTTKHNTSNSALLTAVLINDEDGTDYPS